MTLPDSSRLETNSEFVEADAALERLHSSLHYGHPSYSPAEERTQLELMYHNGCDEVRYKVITELIDLECKAARPLLVEALATDTDPLVRHEAAFGLGVLCEASNIAPLRRALQNDENLMVRHEAAIALAEYPTEEVRQALAEALSDESPEVVSSARYSLQNISLQLSARSD